MLFALFFSPCYKYVNSNIVHVIIPGHLSGVLVSFSMLQIIACIHYK